VNSSKHKPLIQFNHCLKTALQPADICTGYVYMYGLRRGLAASEGIYGSSTCLLNVK